MSPVQGKSPPVQVKEPYRNLDIFTCRLYKVHLPIILERGSGSIYISIEKEGKRERVYHVYNEEKQFHIGEIRSQSRCGSQGRSCQKWSYLLLSQKVYFC